MKAVADENLDLAGFAAHLLEYNLSPRTISGYVSNVRMAAERGDLLARLRDQDLAPMTRHRNLAALRSFAEYREDAGLLKRLKKISRQIPPARRVTPKTPLSREQWFALQEAINDHPVDAERAALGIMAVRGLRMGDVLRTRPREINKALQTGTLTYQAKGERWLEFTAEPMRPYLATLVERRGWSHVWDLLTPPRSIAQNPGHQAAKRLMARLDTLAEAAGIQGGVLPHRLRRTYAVQFYEACGRDLVALQEHMQWASLETAKDYVDHARREELDEVAARMRKR